MIKSTMSYDRLAMEPPGALSQEGYARSPDIEALRSTAAHWALLAALTTLYILGGKLGLLFDFVHASATAVWPPTGIALAAFLLFGPRVWSAVAVGAFLVNVTTAGSVATSLGVAAGNTLEGLLSAWLVNRFAHGRYAFERAQDIFAFVVAVVPGALVSATMGVASLALGGYALWAGFGPIWATWWLGDITGALIIAPPLLLWADRRSSLLLRHPVESACLVLSVALGGYAVFGGSSPLGPRHPLAILCLPPLVWAAFRFGRRAAATAILLLSGIALYGTVKGFGPFAVAPADSLLMLQTFLATMAVMTLSMAALVWDDVRERKRVEGERERARVEAEAASRAKDEFFAMLGHELRNPLGVITTALHVLQVTGPLDERGAKAREIIARQVVTLVRLVDDLLDVTRLATGKIALSPSPINLGAAAQRAATAVAAGAPGRHITCHALGDLWIHADETRLEQILLNLLHNAVKFTPSDGRIVVAVMGEGSDAVLRVEDTGAGIPADLLPRIFDLFVQGQTGLHRTGAGLGIGLTLVKRLVDLHKGRIDVTSAGPGRGSAFTVRFPRIEPAVPPPASEPARAAGTARRRILIVEDNADARQMLRHLLELSDHEVHEAADGLKGLEQALVLHPDAVVIDLGLPGLDGYQVAQRIRAAGRRDMVLIAVTGYGQREDRLRSSAAGFDAHLTKPVDPTVLDALLDSHPPG
jgi:signal transduction histidine kinase/CheY-like chemotaxis protein